MPVAYTLRLCKTMIENEAILCIAIEFVRNEAVDYGPV